MTDQWRMCMVNSNFPTVKETERPDPIDALPARRPARRVAVTLTETARHDSLAQLIIRPPNIKPPSDS
jgi:hypothetical protein